MKSLVFFYNDLEIRKLLAKLNKITKKIEVIEGENFEGVDIDKLFEYCIEEFFEMKNRNYKALSKKFAKVFETENGLISFDDYKGILNESSEQVSPLKKCEFSNEILKLKSYLFAITSGKNSNDLANRDFNAAVLKFGMDCPFPLVNTKKKVDKFIENVKIINEKKENLQIKDENLIEKSIEKSMSFKSEKKNSVNLLLNNEINSAIFGQHFAILRELRMYCTQFKNAVGEENDTQVLMKHFQNIINIIELACQFLKFPIKI